jgi:hypothetical protein
MRSPVARAAIALGAIAAVVVLFVVLAGGDDGGDETATTTEAPAQTQTGAQTGTTGPAAAKPKPARPPIEQVVVVGGRARGGVKRLTFDSGERVRFAVKSDVSDEVHVHGYDVSKRVPAGGSVRFGFPARLEGVFEVELEERGEQIAELRVTP